MLHMNNQCELAKASAGIAARTATESVAHVAVKRECVPRRQGSKSARATATGTRGWPPHAVRVSHATATQAAPARVKRLRHRVRIRCSSG